MTGGDIYEKETFSAQRRDDGNSRHCLSRSGGNGNAGQ